MKTEYPLGTKIIYPNGQVSTLTRITTYPYPELPEHTWEHVLEKPRTKTMVDSHKARIWLAKTCAGIKALARELETANVDDAFSLVYELRGKLWYEAEEFKGQL